MRLSGTLSACRNRRARAGACGPTRPRTRTVRGHASGESAQTRPQSGLVGQSWCPCRRPSAACPGSCHRLACRWKQPP
eukprot:scaffold105484_cov28-Tisochrysis_lutea.AAC.1